MPPRKARRERRAQNASDGAGSGAGAAGGAGSGASAVVSAQDAALGREGEALLKGNVIEMGPVDLASAAWLHVLGRPRRGATGDDLHGARPARLVVHSDVLWYQLSRMLALYPMVDAAGRGPRVSVGSSTARLLGVRCAREATHLGLSDEELMRTVHESVTEAGGELLRVAGVDAVVHGDEGTGVQEGPGSADEEACARGMALFEKWQEASADRRAWTGTKRLRDLREALEGAEWVRELLLRLGGVKNGSVLPRRAWLVRAGDLDDAAFAKAFAETGNWQRSLEQARVDGKEAVEFWGPGGAA